MGDPARVTPGRGAELTFPSIPDFSLAVERGSATFPDGSRNGVMRVREVEIVSLPAGPTGEPQVGIDLLTLPSDVRFDPPAPITFPNVDGHRPGEVVTIFSFDHDIADFVSIGTGTVSGDGRLITSDPGQRILKGE